MLSSLTDHWLRGSTRLQVKLENKVLRRWEVGPTRPNFDLSAQVAAAAAAVTQDAPGNLDEHRVRVAPSLYVNARNVERACARHGWDQNFPNPLRQRLQSGARGRGEVRLSHQWNSGVHRHRQVEVGRRQVRRLPAGNRSPPWGSSTQGLWWFPRTGGTQKHGQEKEWQITHRRNFRGGCSTRKVLFVFQGVRLQKLAVQLLGGSCFTC